MLSQIFKKSIKLDILILLVSLIFTIIYNGMYFRLVGRAYLDNLPVFISFSLMLFFASTFVLSILCYRYSAKFILIFCFLVASLTSYFSLSFGLTINQYVLLSAMHTNAEEVREVLNYKVVLYFIIFGLLPSIVIYRLKIDYKIKYIFKIFKFQSLVFILLIFVNFFIFSHEYEYVSRYNKQIKTAVNPYYQIFLAVRLIRKDIIYANIKHIGILKEAVEARTTKEHKLLIVVVGESSRYDRWSLNGYKRETNPLLSKEGVISLSMYSCGTYTLYSVPCMFSEFGRKNYSYKKGIVYESIVDRISELGIYTFWLNTYFTSNQVAMHSNFKTVTSNVIYKNGDSFEYDEELLKGLNKIVTKGDGKDILIVLHTVGSHYNYFNRYPKKFEKYKPICKKRIMSSCNLKYLENGYDNTILYTDYFLYKTIEFLKKHGNKYISAMVYLSDHGESLGEYGMFAHMAPYATSPVAQRHIPAILWFNKDAKKHFINMAKIDRKKRYSHDYLFHTILGFFQVKTRLYKPNLDIFKYKK